MTSSNALDYTTPDRAGATQKILFWGCFIALITTAFAFIGRMFLIDVWAVEFGLDKAQAGRLAGIGIWPFAVSIIGFSLFLDRIGYKVAMIMAFLGHIVWAVMGVSAFFVSKNGDKETAYQLVYWGSLIVGLANGTVEAFINPVVATMFNRDKVKWLNILHAGWPGGLVVAGITTIFIDFVPWWIKVGIIAIPAVVYFLMLIPLAFPAQERVAAGVSYREMLSEFGTLGALVVGFLVSLQLMDFFGDANKGLFIAIGIAIVAAFAAYTRSLGRPFMFFMVLIMMPLATTEIGTDGWIEGIMKGVFKEIGIHSGWVLVYTSVIMMILRFCAGPIIHSLSPLGLLALSAALAIGGLTFLSSAATIGFIFIAATLYGFGKTFFWPTMLGVISEQTPKGGALTLNAISGIGMLAVGVLGFPYIGALQSGKQIDALAASPVVQQVPGAVKDGKLAAEVLAEKTIYEIIAYKTVDDAKLNGLVEKLPADPQAKTKAEITNLSGRSAQGALGNMAYFPMIMLVGYLILIGYFKSRGGYKPIHLETAAQPESVGAGA